MSLETVYINPLPLVGAETNETGKDKERYGLCDIEHMEEDQGLLYDRSSSWNTEQGKDEELEDGELEDGEIDDPEIEPVVAEPAAIKERKEEKRSRRDRSPHKTGSEDDSEDDDKSRKRRKKKKRRDRKRDDKDKSKKKKRKYVDHDQVSEDGNAIADTVPTNDANWPAYGRSPSGSYNSPPYDGNDRRPTQFYGDAEGRVHKSGSPRCSNRNSHQSPPGPYDSPSDEDEYGPPPKLHRAISRSGPEYSRYDSNESSNSSRQQSLLSMVGDSNYLDANVAANEHEDLFGRGPKGGFKKKKNDKFFKDRHKEPHQKKRSLHETPMNERPQCKFHMEGKCQKGADCPFNHDFEPPLRFELCKFYITNQCSRGSGCLYMHDDYPCKFYHLDGSCQYEDRCRFSHAKLSAELFTLFKKQVQARDMTDDFYNDRNPDNYDDSGGKSSYHNKNDGYYGTGSNNDDYGGQSPHARSPPHNQSNNMKKIPSIFDIEVFPPGKGPRPPGQQNQGGPMPNLHANSGMQSPQGHPRPNFYPDRSGPPQGNTPQGPHNGPPRGPPPVQQGLLGPHPPMRFRGMRPTNGPGPMGPMGPVVSMGPMRHPGQRPMGPMGPPGPMMAPGMMRQQAPDYFNNAQFFGGSPMDTNQSADQFINSRGDTDMRQPPTGIDASMSDDKSVMEGQDESIPHHLPPKQRELFMRIKQHQHENGASGGVMKEDLEQALKNENWYSSDEDDSSHKEGNAISNLWASLTQGKQGIDLPAPGPQGPSDQMPKFDIAQMLTAIRSMTGVPNPPTSISAPSNVNVARDPRQSSAKVDPRLARINSDPRITQQAMSPTRPQISSPQQTPPIDETPEIDGSIAMQTKTGTRVLYVLHTCDTNIVLGKIPAHVDINSERYKDDPRIQKALNKLDPRKAKPSLKIPSSPLTKSASMGPPASSPKVDPRLQRTVSVPAPVLPAPAMPDALKERPVANRRYSTDNVITSPTGDTSPQPVTKESSVSTTNVTLAYRNDPRYRKKKHSGDNQNECNINDNVRSSPEQENTKENTKDIDNENHISSSFRGMDYASPLGREEKITNSGFGFYNQPPNDNYQQLQDQKRSNRQNETGNSPDSSLKTPDNMQQPTSLTVTSGMDIQSESLSLTTSIQTSMRDVFKTLDPTASPFC